MTEPTAQTTNPSEPFCGAAPLAHDWHLRWTLDPGLIAGLVGALLLLEWWLRAEDAGNTRRRAAELRSGWLLVAFALVSPLCALSVALFSARIAQHLVLLYVAAPLLAHALARPPRPADHAKPERAAVRAGLVAPGLVFTGLFWFWHVPGPYASTFESDSAYWAMHLSLLAAAVAAWHGILDRPEGPRALGALLAAAVLLMQMGLLGAVLAFANRPLYEPHFLTTLSFGLTALEDQQLGGLLMWVPGAIAPLAIALWLLATLLRDPQRR